MIRTRAIALAAVFVALATGCSGDDQQHVVVEISDIPADTTAIELTITLRDTDYVVHVFDEPALDDAIGDDGVATFAVAFDDRGDVSVVIDALAQGCVIAEALAECPEGCGQVRAALKDVTPPRCPLDDMPDAGVPDANNGRT